jgi:signal transduction histidine kinase
MTLHRHRRQVSLLLAAIILPCVVLVVLGIRIIGQERELREKRVADERRRITNQIRQNLSAQLERISLQEATALAAEPGHASSYRYGHPAVALVARVADGRLVLPWESDPRPERFRRLVRQEGFTQIVTQAERAELESGNAEEAARLYREAVAMAGSVDQAVFGRLLLARALATAGRRREALAGYRRVLAIGRDVVDEHGVPLSNYAATRLLGAGSGYVAVLEYVSGAVAARRWLSPTALYMLRDLAHTLQESAPDSVARRTAQDLAATIDRLVDRTEQATALQRDFRGLGLGARVGAQVHGARSRWVPYGAPPWLVGAAPAARDAPEVAVAVVADSAFTLVANETAESNDLGGAPTIASRGSPNGESLGASFPGLVVQFRSAPDEADGAPWDTRRWFYLITLLLVLSVTLLGAYLVSRDVRRELQLAETRSRFVSAVSHELKTPLTAIRMFAETLQLGRSTDPEVHAEYLETIVNESERLTRLLNNVLDFSKIERGQKVYRPEPACLAEIVESSARAMRYPLQQQQVELTVQIEDGVPPARVDRDAVEQAILNLLANAMKYSGGSQDIALRLRRANGFAAIEVADRGPGIEPDEQERIFEQFYRVLTRQNEGIPGTGLGLTLVRHIAEAHGGRATVQSAPGQGSTFTIHLPLEHDAA